MITAGHIPNHPLNFAIRGLPVIALYLVTSGWNPMTPQWPEFGRAVFAFATTFWFGFDTLLNVSTHKPITHLGNTPIDLLQKNYPNEFVWFVWKAMLCVFGLLWFYFDPYGFTLR